MRMIECDRCGCQRYFTEDIPSDWRTFTAVGRDQIKMDLCPACVKALLLFLKGREEKKGEEPKWKKNSKNSDTSRPTQAAE